MDLFDFFYQELSTLKAKTGFNQWEKLHESSDPEGEIKALIGFMIESCNKPPFNIVKPDVKMRVIANAIVEDQEFTGLNAKFVTKALNAWWRVNGDRVMEKLQQQEEIKVEPLSPEKSAEISRMLDKYINDLLSGDSGMQVVPKIEGREAKIRGREWKSNIENKVPNYSNGLTPEEYAMRRSIQEAGSKFYKQRHSLNLKEFTIEGFRVMAESKADAEEIYKTATEQ